MLKARLNRVVVVLDRSFVGYLINFVVAFYVGQKIGDALSWRDDIATLAWGAIVFIIISFILSALDRWTKPPTHGLSE